jgi:hypothetical protein
VTASTCLQCQVKIPQVLQKIGLIVWVRDGRQGQECFDSTTLLEVLLCVGKTFPMITWMARTGTFKVEEQDPTNLNFLEHILGTDVFVLHV